MCIRDRLNMALRGLTNGGAPPAAVMSADAYGSCADYSRIEAICRHYGVPLIEDASASLGATHNDRPAGSFGVLAVLNFDNERLVTGGGGGALVGPRHIVERARSLADQGRRPSRPSTYDEVGYSYALSNLLAAVASAQLSRLDQIVERTRAINARYASIIALVPGVSLVDIDRDGHGNGWLSVAHIDRGVHPTPGEIGRRMAEHGIETRPAMKPLHRQKHLSECRRVGGVASEMHFSSGLVLPSGASMTNFDQERVISSLLAALRPSPDPLSQVSVIDLNTELDIRSAQPRQRRDSRLPTQRAA